MAPAAPTFGETEPAVHDIGQNGGLGNELMPLKDQADTSPRIAMGEGSWIAVELDGSRGGGEKPGAESEQR